MGYCECLCTWDMNAHLLMLWVRICAVAILRQYMLYNPPYEDDFSWQMIVVKIWM